MNAVGITTPRPPASAGARRNRRFSSDPAASRSTVVEVGGALGSYTSDGRPLLDGHELHERCAEARGRTMIP